MIKLIQLATGRRFSPVLRSNCALLVDEERSLLGDVRANSKRQKGSWSTRMEAGRQAPLRTARDWTRNEWQTEEAEVFRLRVEVVGMGKWAR